MARDSYKNAILDSLTAAIMNIPRDVMSYKLQALQLDLQKQENEKKREHDMALNAQRLMVNTYDQKQKDFNLARKALDKFGDLPAEFTSLDGPQLRDNVIKDNQIDMNALQENISIYSNRINQLDDQLTTLSDQKTIFNDYIPEFAGINKSLQWEEYQDFRRFALAKDLATTPEVEGLGWTTTAGADLAYREAMSPEQRTRHLDEQHELYTSRYTTEASKKFELLKALYATTDADGNQIDVSTQLTSGAHTPNPVVLSEISNIMFQKGTDWKGFVDYLEMAPGDMGEAMINELGYNPRTMHIFNDLVGAADSVQALQDEYEGLQITSHIDSFSSSLETVNSLPEAFSLFHDTAGSIRGRAQKEELFSLIESNLRLNPDGLDLGNAFDEYLFGLDPPPPTSNILPISIQGNTDPLAQFDGNGEELFAYIEEAWGTLSDEEKHELYKEFGSDTIGGKKIFVDVTQKAFSTLHFGGEGFWSTEYDPISGQYTGGTTPLRPNWSPATGYNVTAIGGGYQDNSYYDSFYSQLESDYDAAVTQDAPAGPDFIHKSGLVQEAHMVDRVMHRYGDNPELVKNMLANAHSAGVASQTTEFTELLTNGKYIGDSQNLTQEYSVLGQLVSRIGRAETEKALEIVDTSSYNDWSEDELKEAYEIHQAGVAEDGGDPMSYDDFVLMATAFDAPSTFGLGEGGGTVGGEEDVPEYVNYSKDQWTARTIKEAYELHVAGMEIETEESPLSLIDFSKIIQASYASPAEYGLNIRTKKHKGATVSHSYIEGWPTMFGYIGTLNK